MSLGNKYSDIYIHISICVYFIRVSVVIFQNSKAEFKITQQWQKKTIITRQEYSKEFPEQLMIQIAPITLNLFIDEEIQMIIFYRIGTVVDAEHIK